MQEISNMRKAADILVAEEQHHIFINRTQRRMNLVFNLDNAQILLLSLRLMQITLLMGLYGPMDCHQYTSLELLL